LREPAKGVGTGSHVDGAAQIVELGTPIDPVTYYGGIDYGGPVEDQALSVARVEDGEITRRRGHIGKGGSHCRGGPYHFRGVKWIDVGHDVVGAVIPGAEFLLKVIDHVIASLPEGMAVTAAAVHGAVECGQAGVVFRDLGGISAVVHGTVVGHQSHLPVGSGSAVVGDHVVIHHQPDVEVVVLSPLGVSFSAPEAKLLGGKSHKPDR